MASKEIIISIQLKDKGVKEGTDAAAKSLSKLEKAQRELNYQFSEEAKELAKVKAATRDQILANNLAAKSAVQMANATKSSRAQSGLNNAILLETSRLASDASYGFTAIANNLSQVVSLFQSFVKTNDGVVASFKQLGQSLLGAGGVMIAIQLLISFGPKIVDFFMRIAGASKLLREAFKDAAGEVENTNGKFTTYIKTLQDSTKSQEEQEDAIKGLKKEFPDYIKQLDEANVSLKDVANNTDAAKKQNDLYRESIIKLAMARAAQNKIDQLAGEQLQNEINLRTKANEKYGMSAEKVADIEKRYDKVLQETTSTGRDRSKELEKEFTLQERNIVRLIKRRKEENEALDNQIDELMKFTDIENKENEKREKSKKETTRIFKEADLDYEKDILASQQRIKKASTKDEEELTAIKFEGIAERAKLKQKEFEEDQTRRLRDFLASNANDEQKRLAEERYDNSIAKSKASLYAFLTQLDKEYTSELDDLRSQRELDDLAGFGRALQAYNNERLKFQEEFLKSYTDSEIDRIEVSKLIEERRFADEMASLTAIRDARIQKGLDTLAIDQEITNAEKRNSDARIMFAEQEGDAKLAIANQVGNAIVSIAGKGTTVGKAASIAMAIMNTREAFTSALGAKPYGPWNIAQAAATLAVGMKQVKDIIATKIPGKDPAGTGSVSIEAPDFNVVGASGQSQLAQTIAGAEAQPVRAFVVGKDISTQQELDRNITNTASFG